MRILLFVSAFAAIILLNACSGVQVLSSWKGENPAIERFTSKKVLVIARTANRQGRIAFEEAMAARLGELGITTVESFKKFPMTNPEEEISEERREQLKKILADEGFGGIVLTSVLDVQQTERTTSTQSGIYAGGYYGNYYPPHYGGFYRYYARPYAYGAYYGGFGPTTTTTSTEVYTKYVLETVGYNMDAPEDESLVFVVTSSIQDPTRADKTAAAYSKYVVNSLSDKKKK
ncbi:MAG: hypothetical protein AAGA85_01310 [Bacteroidota bacterium]